MMNGLRTRVYCDGRANKFMGGNLSVKTTLPCRSPLNILNGHESGLLCRSHTVF